MTPPTDATAAARCAAVAEGVNRTITRAATSIGSDAADVEGAEKLGDGGNVVVAAEEAAAADEASTDVLVRKASKRTKQVCRKLPLIRCKE